MFAKIARAIVRALSALASAPFHAVDWIFGRILGGGAGGPGIAPDFEPVADADVLGDHLMAQRRRSESEILAHQDAVRTVEKYLRAIPAARATVDLTGLSVPVRTALLDMSSAELDTLKGAGLSGIRKFVDQTVPAADVRPETPPVYVTITSMERLSHKIRAQQMRDQHSEPYEDPRLTPRPR